MTPEMENQLLRQECESLRQALAAAQADQDLHRLTQTLREERDFNSALLESSGALIIVLDAEGRILRFNRACERVSGHSAPEVIGQLFWEYLLPAEQVGRMRVLFSKPLPHGLPTHYENHWVTKSGELRLISWTNSIIPHPDGSLRAIVASGLDITEQRRLESEVLEIADREQRRIGMDLHDGLGQQLTAISLLCQTLQQDLIHQPDLLERINKLGFLLRQAIRHTRSLSKGLTSLHPDGADLAQILGELTESTSALGQVQCHFRCEGELPHLPALITNHLSQIAREAVNNALKHGQPTRIDLELGFHEGAIHLRIADDGTGLPEGNVAKGVGMAVMKYRANLLGGTFNVTSAPGRGVAIDCVVFLKQ